MLMGRCKKELILKINQKKKQTIFVVLLIGGT